MYFEIKFTQPKEVDDIIDTEKVKDLTDKLFDVFEKEKCSNLEAMAAIFRILHCNKVEK